MKKTTIVSVLIGITGWTLSVYWLGWKASVVFLLIMTANNMDLNKKIK